MNESFIKLENALRDEFCVEVTKTLIYSEALRIAAELSTGTVNKFGTPNKTRHTAAILQVGMILHKDRKDEEGYVVWRKPMRDEWIEYNPSSYCDLHNHIMKKTHPKTEELIDILNPDYTQ